MIENLPLLAPDTSRSARTRARCQQQLAQIRQQQEPAAPERLASTAPRRVERLLLAGLCVVYLLSMAGNVLRVVLTT